MLHIEFYVLLAHPLSHFFSHIRIRSTILTG